MKTNERIEETLEKLWEQLEENTGGNISPEILDPEQNAFLDTLVEKGLVGNIPRRYPVYQNRAGRRLDWQSADIVYLSVFSTTSSKRTKMIWKKPHARWNMWSRRRSKKRFADCSGIQKLVPMVSRFQPARAVKKRG